MGAQYGDGSIIKCKDGRLRVTVMVGGKPRYAMISARLVKSDYREAKRLAEERRNPLVALRDGG